MHPSSSPSPTPINFKQQLTHLHADFTRYTKQHKSKGIPIQYLVILMQKYIKVQPTSLETLLSRTIATDEVSWEFLLMYIQQEINLEDEVNKMRASRPSVIDIEYYADCDEHLGQKVCDVIAYIKKKSTNYIKLITKAEFLGFKLLVIVLERETIFYDCEDKKIIQYVSFRYNNVRNKMLTSVQSREKSRDHYNASFLVWPHKNTNNSDLKSPLLRRQFNQQVDKVLPMSRRTEEQAHSFSLKSHKNTNQSEELKNMLTNNMKNSKAASSISADDSAHNYENIKRSVTMMDYNMRENSKVYKFGSLQNNSIKIKQKEKEKSKEFLKIRSGDTASIFKLITESKIEGSMEVIKAYRNSIQSFEKYVQIDKSKIQKQKDEMQQFKQPSGINAKFDYKKQIKKMKEASKQLTLKKNLDASFLVNTPSRKSYGTKTRHRTHTQPKADDRPFFNSTIVPDSQSSNTFIGLQKRILEIQSISFCQNYMVVSLMNCQLRLYQFKRTIHGFSQELVFQKSYNSLPTNVLLYRSSVRKLFNICVILSKSHNEPTGNTAVHREQSDIRRTNLIQPMHKQTEIYVYELSIAMTIEKQSYQTYLSYSPIICNMMPLGIGGYLQCGNFFLVELNCTSTPKSQIKSIDTVLTHPDHGQRASISCMKVHRNLTNLYIGCKEGDLYVYDRLIDKVRIRNRITNAEIVDIMFIVQSNQVMFWDANGKIGVVNANTLSVSNVVSLLGPIGRGIGGNGNGSGYWAMVDYFIQNQFIVYGDRTIGLVSLFENAQKKFNAQKPLKIYNRRMSIKNRTKIDSSITQTPTKYSTAHKIHKYFSSPQCLILLASSGQIMVYDRTITYIGSYFTMNYITVTQCICCPALKYIFLLHENNDMQVANIYTQQQLLSVMNIKEEVYDIFFANSSVYFCGYLNASRYQLCVYGYGDGKNVGYIAPLVTVNLCDLVLNVSLKDIREREKQQERDSKFSKNSNFSLSTVSRNVDMDIRFFKGSMIIVKKQDPQIVFLYKKTYSRNCTIKCKEYFKYPQNQSLIAISHTFIDLQANLLTVLFINAVLMVINLETKSVKHICVLQKREQMVPFQHYYDSSNMILAVLLRDNQQENESFQYCLYSLKSSQEKIELVPTLLYSIQREPAQSEQKLDRMRKLSAINPAIKYKQSRKGSIDVKIQPPTENLWSGCPMLIDRNVVLMSKDHNYCNVYKIKAYEEKNKGQNIAHQNQNEGFFTQFSKIQVE